MIIENINYDCNLIMIIPFTVLIQILMGIKRWELLNFIHRLLFYVNNLMIERRNEVNLQISRWNYKATL